jgi:two-component system sensor histidine kinase/response regulator
VPPFVLEEVMQEDGALKADILVADDTPANLRLLFQMLTEQGYKVRPVPDGQWALRAARSTPPDLILLDIRMPKMDGYQVCEQLKADEQTRDIPVLFLSALGEKEDKVKAFSVGGLDYITKPFQVEEVLARVRTHLALRALQNELETANERLVRSNAELRARNEELDAFVHTVAHDLKSPLAIVAGYAEVLALTYEEMEPEEIEQILGTTTQMARKLARIVDNLLLLARARKEDATILPLCMAEIVADALERLDHEIAASEAEIVVPDQWPTAVGYGPWVEEVWVNYVSNALKYGGRPPRVELGADSFLVSSPMGSDEGGKGLRRFWVRDDGDGLDAEQQSTLFTEFTRLHELSTEGYGLGLSIVRRIVERLGGQVGVTSTVGQGSEFFFTLPQDAESRR